MEQDGGGTISQTTMQMILKSMGVKVDKDELENYAGEADEAGTGKFSFTTFCQGRVDQWRGVPMPTA